ncbi:MAG: MFS transporter [Bacteroidales bacterium]|nr:MFS transporter [Bacteroidales bacterium]
MEQNKPIQNLYGYVVWFVISLFVVFSFCLNTAAGVFSGAIEHTLNLTETQTAIAMGAFIVGFALMQIPAGALLDRFNNKLIVSCAIFILTAGAFLISRSSNLISFSLANFIMGIGGSFAFIAAGKSISKWFSFAAFPLMFGLTNTLSCFSTGFIHTLLSDQLAIRPWETVYLFLAIAGAILCIITLIFFHDPKKDVIETNSGPKPSLISSVHQVIRIPKIWLCSLSAAFSFGALLAYVSFWYVKVENFYQVPEDQILFFATLTFMGVGLGTFFWGLIARYVKVLNTLIHSTLIMGTLFLLVGIYLPHFNINTLIIAETIAFCIGFFLGGSQLFYTIAANMVPKHLTGIALSVVNTVVFLVNTLLLSLPYAFDTKTSTFYNTLWLFPFCIVISIGLLAYLKPPKPATSNQ